MIQKNIKCEGCSNVTKNFEVFVYITLELGAKNLQEAYQNYINYKDHCESLCEHCDTKSKTLTKEMIKLPEYCIFQINRFNFKDNRKNQEFLEYPETLSLSDKYKSDIKYELKCLIVHNGGLERGHYITVGLKKNQWVKFDDSEYTTLKEPDQLNNQAYILFYKRAKN